MHWDFWPLQDTGWDTTTGKAYGKASMIKKHIKHKNQRVDYRIRLSLINHFFLFQANIIKKSSATSPFVCLLTYNLIKKFRSVCLISKYAPYPISIDKKIKNNNCRVSRTFLVMRLCPTSRWTFEWECSLIGLVMQASNSSCEARLPNARHRRLTLIVGQTRCRGKEVV